MSLSLNRVSLALGGRPLVKDLTLTLEPGEVIGLLGPNGAGKTTSFNLVIGLLKPDQGEVLMDGHPVASLSMPQRARLGIGYLPQEPSVFRQLTVRENLELVLSQTGLAKAQARERLHQLIDDFHLQPFLNRKGFQLSGGERRRCEVARALAVGLEGPRYLLLDEPFAGIDPIAVGDIRDLVAHLKDRGIGVLITDHNVRETLGICSRAYILSDGEVIAEGAPETILDNAQVRSVYLGDSFQL